jgi:hypothetical protein
MISGPLPDQRAQMTTRRSLAWVLIIASAVALVALTTSATVASAQATALELDHAYTLVPPGAVAAINALRRVGIVIDTQTVKHDGEGTTSIAAFFENAYLELMWVDSSVSVDSAHQLDVAEFRRATAWRETGASPFGVGLHFLSGSVADLTTPYRLDVVPESDPAEYYVILRQPAESLAADVFIMPQDGAVTSWIGRFRNRQPNRFAHPAGFRRITRVVVHGTHAMPSALAGLDVRLVGFVASSEPLMEVQFDGGGRGETWDLRPALPVILSR